MFLQALPFGKDFLIVIHLESKGKWFVIEQVASLIFDWPEGKLRHKILFDGISSNIDYNLIQINQSSFESQLLWVTSIDPKIKTLHLILSSKLETFLKNYTRRKRVNLFYDIIHQFRNGR